MNNHFVRAKGGVNDVSSSRWSRSDGVGDAVSSNPPVMLNGDIPSGPSSGSVLVKNSRSVLPGEGDCRANIVQLITDNNSV